MKWVLSVFAGTFLAAALAADDSGHAGPVTDIVTLNGEVFSCSQGGLFRGTDPVFDGKHSLDQRATALAGSGDRLLFATGKPAESGSVAIFDLKLKEGYDKLPPISNDLIYSVALSGRFGFAALADGRVLELDLQSPPPYQIRHRHTAAARAVAVSSDGKFLASGGMDRLVIVSDLKTEAEPISIQDHTERVDCLVFSPDSKVVASGARDGKVRLHDPATGKLLRTYSGLTGEVSSLAWGEKPERLLAGTSEGKIYQLNLADDSAAELADWGIESPITALAISPEGKVYAGTLNRLASIDHVACTARMTDFDGKSPWFENITKDDGTIIHDDGVAPRAQFQIEEPSAFAGREIAILFKYTSEKRPNPPKASDKGDLFSFEMPIDFFDGDFKSIDNINVENFLKTPETKKRSNPVDSPN